MGTYQTKAIVLRNRNLGEADRIVVLLSEDHGKIEAVAKGARRGRSRFVGNTLPFNYLNVMLFSGKTLDQLNQAEVIRSFGALREDLVRMAYASYWVELLDAFVPEQEGEGEVFRFLLAAFLTLEQTSRPELLNLAFQARLLNYLGYQPKLDSCVQCENPAEARLFSAAVGGVVCASCARAMRDLITVKPEEIRQLVGLQCCDIRELAGLGITGDNLLTLQKVLRGFIEYRLDRPLKSQVFLDNILMS